MTEKDKHFSKLKEGKSLVFIVHHHDQQALKVGEALAADAILGEGTASMGAKGVDQREQEQS